MLHWQRQARQHVVLDGRQMGLAHLLPDAGGRITADHAVVKHGNAGTADHRVEFVAHHKVCQRAPQRHDHAAVAVIGVHTATAQFHHPGAQGAQARQVKFGIAVGSAHPLGLRRRQHPVSPNDLQALGVAHQKVLAVVVEEVHVVARNGGRQSSAHLCRKHLKAQALRLADFVQMPGPGHLNGATRRGNLRRARYNGRALNNAGAGRLRRCGQLHQSGQVVHGQRLLRLKRAQLASPTEAGIRFPGRECESRA